ncbi:MAG: HAD-IIIC family phosphatase, partial [Gemmatimonadales bacterium]
MNFLEARRIVAEFRGGEPLPFLLGMSGTADPLLLYLRAEAARRGREAVVRTLPFGTLGQALLGPAGGEREVFLLLPWDLLPEADWRSGLPAGSDNLVAFRDRAGLVASRLRGRGAALVYVPAPLPPLLSHPDDNRALALWLEHLALECGARVMQGSHFSLGGYLSSGCPVGGSAQGMVAEALMAALLDEEGPGAKVLVTDLDNVMWSGVIAEDGLEGIAFGAEGAGYRHFVYQTMLAQLKEQGVLLAAVSRNDPEVALAPLGDGRMRLGEEDFVAVVASYHAKSAQIRELANRLNLGLDAFVFVDDNPVELAEVGAELPEVHALEFPGRDDGLPALMEGLARLFARRTLTPEDRERTEMYRSRLAGMVPSDVEGADLTEFLRDLGMRLTIHDRSTGSRTRAVQLINKTNQFNLNGRRVTDEQVGEMLAAGGRLYTASLEDRHGQHGEILACLVSADGVVESFVMSCRVFQRRVEHAFTVWLAYRPSPPVRFVYARTERNGPLRSFLEDDA